MLKVLVVRERYRRTTLVKKQPLKLIPQIDEEALIVFFINVISQVANSMKSYIKFLFIEH